MNKKEIIGYPGYRVSIDGVVESARRYPGIWIPLKPAFNSSGYLTVFLYRDGIGESNSIHRLVLETFVGPCPTGMEACHNNGDKSDNRLSNLRWDTRISNVLDKEKHLGINVARGIGVYNRSCKLSEHSVKTIRELSAGGLSSTEIAIFFGISDTHVRHIVTGRYWKHLKV